MREAIVTLTDSELEELGFTGLGTHLREAGIRDVRLLEGREEWCVPKVEVRDRRDEAELTSLDCVDRCELVAETTGTYRYVLELTPTGLPEGTVEAHDELLGSCETAVNGRGVPRLAGRVARGDPSHDP